MSEYATIPYDIPDVGHRLTREEVQKMKDRVKESIIGLEINSSLCWAHEGVLKSLDYLDAIFIRNEYDAFLKKESTK